MERQLRVGLTGSIGMGKSTVAGIFRAEGVPVFDADEAVHELQGPGGKAVHAIEAAFPGTTGPLGVDRQKLGALVLNDDAAMQRLEAILHPAVAKERERFLEMHRKASLVVFDIPLLFERTGRHGLDAVIVVTAPEQIQRQRVLGRPGMTMAKLAAILARQMPDAEKRARADHIIDNGGTVDETRDQVKHLIACLLGQTGR